MAHIECTQIITLWEVLSAALTLGNVKFENKYNEDDCDECVVTNTNDVEIAATLLRVELSELLEVKIKCP